MKPWPTSCKWDGQTLEQKRIMQWVRENVDYGRVLSVMYIDRNHMRLTDCYCSNHLLTYEGGDVTMTEIEEAC